MQTRIQLRVIHPLRLPLPDLQISVISSLRRAKLTVIHVLSIFKHGAYPDNFPIHIFFGSSLAATSFHPPAGLILIENQNWARLPPSGVQLKNLSD
jgi:hypothetical protein